MFFFFSFLHICQQIQQKSTFCPPLPHPEWFQRGCCGYLTVYLYKHAILSIIWLQLSFFLDCKETSVRKQNKRRRSLDWDCLFHVAVGCFSRGESRHRRDEVKEEGLVCLCQTFCQIQLVFLKKKNDSVSHRSCLLFVRGCDVELRWCVCWGNASRFVLKQNLWFSLFLDWVTLTPVIIEIPNNNLSEISTLIARVWSVLFNRCQEMTFSTRELTVQLVQKFSDNIFCTLFYSALWSKWFL